MEYLDIYDEEKKFLGTEERNIVHRDALWHNTVHCWLYDIEGNVYFQIRKEEEKLYTTASGHVLAGETIKEAFGPNNRFKFCNTFNAKHAHDALYYILYAWRQLGYNVDNDEIHVCGDIVHKDWLLENLRKHVTRAYAINPVADFNRARATAIPNIEYDLLALHLSANI